MMKVDPPLAVVVGSGLNALGVIRSLARGGIPICVLGSADGCAMRSRHGQKIALGETSGTPLIRALEDLSAKTARRAVLFLTEEKSVQTISEFRAEMQERFHLRLPDPATLASLLDKTQFQRLAESTGGCIPAATALRSADDISMLARVRFPCVLKPSWKNYEYGAQFSKAYVVASADEAARLYGEIAPVMPDMIVQEWIDGEDYDVYFCLQYIGRGGETVASFAGRKLRSWPPRIGGTASCIATPDQAAELESATSQFFRAIGFQGMGSMEFKRDRRDGRFYMVEPTVGRTDFQEEVATVNGVNIPLAAYLHEIEGPPMPMKAAYPPRLWREPQIDRWALERLGQPPIEATISHRVVDAYFRIDDPGPWFDSVLRRARGRLESALRRAIPARVHR